MTIESCSEHRTAEGERQTHDHHAGDPQTRPEIRAPLCACAALRVSGRSSRAESGSATAVSGLRRQRVPKVDSPPGSAAPGELFLGPTSEVGRRVWGDWEVVLGRANGTNILDPP